MQQEISLSKILVERLHGQFNINVALKPGLNIIYGKNGRGKTTLLHLLANAGEQNFKLFSHLNFRKIIIENSKGDRLELIKEKPNALPEIKFNDSLTGFSIENPNLTEVEKTSLRAAFGGRATYLPAFRSVLERTSRRSPAWFRASETPEDSSNEITESELLALKENTSAKSLGRLTIQRELRDQAQAIAHKTLLCRQWFGPFVPVVRYPSIADVDDGLSEEWRSAELTVYRREQRMFEETFLKIFKSIAGIEKVDTVKDTKNILVEISRMVEDKKTQLIGYGPDEIYEQLASVVQNVNLISEANNPLLEIYRQALEKGNEERQAAFQRSQDFVDSINRFLDNKSLKIGFPPTSGDRKSNLVSVHSTSGQSYGLSALSSGERQILTMLFSASRTKVETGAFLIDEPELSLHIDWQRIILKEIQKQSPNRQIVACTHSPEVGADHLEDTLDFEPENASIVESDPFAEEEI